MAQAAAAARADPGRGAAAYRRHQPEHALLYRIVAQHYPAFVELLAGQGRPLPDYVQQEFEAYLKCGRLEHGFLRVRCESCHAEHLVAFSCKRRGFCPSCGARRMAESAALLVDEVFPEQPVRQWVLSVPYPLRFLFASRPDIMGAVLGIVYRVIAAHLARQAGFSAKRARTGAVTLIQRFGGALNLNLHFHMLFLDGVYVERPDGALTFRWVKAPTSAELSALAQHIASRVGRFLERQGLLERDAETTRLSDLALEDEPMEGLLAHSITYRIAVGPRAGRKVFTLQSLPAGDEGSSAAAGKVGGFSLHAGVAARADERDKLERCAATSAARRCRRRGYRSPPAAWCATNSRHRTATAPRTCSSSRWISSPGWPRWCPNRESISLATTVAGDNYLDRSCCLISRCYS